MLMVERFEDEVQLVIKFSGRRDDKFVRQFMKPVGLYHEVCIAQLFGERIDHLRKVFRPGQLGFSKRPHLLQPNLY